jgi:RNA-directed DNA polymerase
MPGDTLVNTGVRWPSKELAVERVLGIQAKLHRWARKESGRRFDDLFNLVSDPPFLQVAWDRVRSNTGARSAGVDGLPAHYVENVIGAETYLRAILDDLRTVRFVLWLCKRG